MTRVAFSDLARDDLEGIAEYIFSRNPARASSFIDELERKCRTLGEFPRIGRPFPALGPNARLIPHKGYLVLYTEKPGTVIVERIVHGARNLEFVLNEMKKDK